jgi:hypothetical protein
LLFAGIKDAHLDAIEHVLERHHLALVVRFTKIGTAHLVGVVDETERVVWDAVARLQPVASAAIAAETGMTEELVTAHLVALHHRRLLMRDGAAYRAPIGAAA